MPAVVISFLRPLPIGVDQQGLATHLNANPLLPGFVYHHVNVLAEGLSAMLIGQGEHGHDDDDFSTELQISGCTVQAHHFMVLEQSSNAEEVEFDPFLEMFIQGRKQVGEKETHPVWQWLWNAEKVVSILGRDFKVLVQLVRWLVRQASELLPKGAWIKDLLKHTKLWDRMVTASSFLAGAAYLDELVALARASPLTSECMGKVCHMASTAGQVVLQAFYWLGICASVGEACQKSYNACRYWSQYNEFCQDQVRPLCRKVNSARQLSIDLKVHVKATTKWDHHSWSLLAPQAKHCLKRAKQALDTTRHKGQSLHQELQKRMIPDTAMRLGMDLLFSVFQLVGNPKLVLFNLVCSAMRNIAQLAMSYTEHKLKELRLSLERFCGPLDSLIFDTAPSHNLPTQVITKYLKQDLKDFSHKTGTALEHIQPLLTLGVVDLLRHYVTLLSARASKFVKDPFGLSETIDQLKAELDRVSTECDNVLKASRRVRETAEETMRAAQAARENARRLMSEQAFARTG